MLDAALQMIIVTKYFGRTSRGAASPAADALEMSRQCFNLFRSGGIEIHRRANEKLLHSGETRFIATLGK
jgi:hypothetical protein